MKSFLTILLTILVHYAIQYENSAEVKPINNSNPREEHKEDLRNVTGGVTKYLTNTTHYHTEDLQPYSEYYKDYCRALGGEEKVIQKRWFKDVIKWVNGFFGNERKPKRRPPPRPRPPRPRPPRPSPPKPKPSRPLPPKNSKRPRPRPSKQPNPRPSKEPRPNKTKLTKSTMKPTKTIRTTRKKRKTTTHSTSTDSDEDTDNTTESTRIDYDDNYEGTERTSKAKGTRSIRKGIKGTGVAYNDDYYT